MNILIVAAHPDDESLGVGATAALHAQKGHAVRSVILGEGATSRGTGRGSAKREQVKILQKAALQAAEVLGVKSVKFHELPDNRFDTVPFLDVVKMVEGEIERFRPEIIYTHHAGDLNVDHKIAHQAVLTAARPLPGSCVRQIYAFETVSATEWSFGLDGAFRPNVFVDVTETLERKLEALAYYRSEMRPFPHPRSPEALRAAAQRWGSVAGYAAAEAFELVRSLQ